MIREKFSLCQQTLLIFEFIFIAVKVKLGLLGDFFFSSSLQPASTTGAAIAPVVMSLISFRRSIFNKLKVKIKNVKGRFDL